MAEWISKTLGEITLFITKGIPPKYVEEENQNTVRVLNQKCNRNFEISYDESRIHNALIKKVPEDKLLRYGDVLINSTGTGTAGRVAQLFNVPVPTTMDGHMILLRPIDEVDPLYYGYAVKSQQKKIESLAEGSTGQTEINRQRLKDEIIITYPKEKMLQKAIGKFLFQIDEKIRNNKRINNNLLEQLNQLYAEFSTRNEWPEMTIGDITDKVAMGPFGSNIKVSTFVEYGVPIISGNHLRGYFLEEPSYNYITKEHAEKLKNSVVYPKDIVFTHAGNIGQVAMIPDGCEFPYYVLSQRQFYLRCNTKLVVPEYVLLFFHSKKGQHELLSYANQTGVPSIAQPATNLKKIRLPIPPLNEQEDWLSVVAPIITMYQNNYQESKRLAALRDALLPKLMSGELDVSGIDL